MISEILKHVDFERANVLLEGFNKSTGFVTAILDLEGNILSQSGWRKICSDFHRKNPKTASNCFVSDIYLANKLNADEKYLFYKCMNGLIDVRLPIVIRGEHIANLFSGQFFFEEPDVSFFRNQAIVNGFDENEYLNALSQVPVISREKVQTAMDFLLYITQLIIEMTVDKMEQIEINEMIKRNEEALSKSQLQLKQNVKDLLESQRIAHLGTWRLDLLTNEVVWSEELYKMYGFDPTTPVPSYTEHMKLFTPKSWNRLSTALENTRTTGIPYELELETVTKDGSNGWMWVRGEAETDSEGTIISLWGAAQDITAYKRIELETKQSEERFQLLFNKAPLGYQSLDYDGRFIEVNQQWLSTLGYNKDEVIGKWFGDFLCPEYVEGFRKRFPIFKAQGFIHSEFEMRCKDGKRLIIAFDGKIGYGADGKFKQTHCILQDITNQRKAEKALIESEERYKYLFENSGVGVGYYTVDGVIISYNKKALEYIGGELEDYVGKSVRDIFPKENADEFISRIKIAVLSDQSQQYEDFMVSVSGLKWFSSTMTKVTNTVGDVIGIQIVSMDTTERKKAEEALLESQAFLNAAFENSPAGIAIADAPDGKLRFVNKAGLLIRDKTEEELVKNVDIHNYVNSWNIFHTNGTPYAEDEVPLTRAVLFGETSSEEFVIRRDNFEDRHVLANATPIKDSNDNIKAGMVVFLDITEKRQAEEKIRNQNDLFSSLLKLLPVGVFMVDAKEGKPLVVNDMGATLLGSGILPDATEENLSEVYKAYKGDTNLSYPTSEMPITLGMRGISSHIDDMVVERPDGSRVLLDVYGTAVTDNEGKPWASLVTFMDITERKKTEHELGRIMAQNQRILDNLQDSYFQADLSGKITVVNPQAVAMFGYFSASELIGQPASLLYTDPEDRLRVLEELKQSGVVNDLVMNGCRKNGETFWVSMNVQFVKDEQGTILGTEGLVRDISERITMQNEIELQRDNLIASNEKLAHLLEQSVNSISKIGELRDTYTAGHQRRVKDLSCAIAKELGLSDEAITNLAYGALIHDIGKINVPTEILNKPGRISNIEFQIIQTHVENGYNIAKGIDFPDVISIMVHQHHERLDGSGYPLGLSGDQIILESRILAVSDVVEAMTSHRPYRPALGLDAALEEISKYRGLKYDDLVVETCIELIKEKGFTFSDSIVESIDR